MVLWEKEEQGRPNRGLRERNNIVTERVLNQYGNRTTRHRYKLYKEMKNRFFQFKGSLMNRWNLVDGETVLVHMGDKFKRKLGKCGH